MEWYIQLLYFMASYVGLVFIFYFTINFMTKGFLGKYLKVKTSKGKLVLVEVKSKTDSYYTTGKFDGEMLRIKTRNKIDKTYTSVPDSGVWGLMGVYVIRVNEGNDFVYTFENEALSGNDPEATDNLMVKILERPTAKDKTIIALIILVVFILLVSFYNSYTLFEFGETLKGIQRVSGLI